MKLSTVFILIFVFVLRTPLAAAQAPAPASSAGGRAEAQMIESPAGAEAAGAPDGQEDLDQVWSRRARGFRTGHNFNVSQGYYKGAWRIDRLQSVSAANIPSQILLSRFAYMFHVASRAGSGFFFGTSAGYGFEQNSHDQGVRLVTETQFPNVMGGRILELSPRHRVGVTLEYGISRYENLGERDDISPDTEVSITVPTVASSLYYDYFWQFEWALRIDAGIRYSRYQRPRGASGTPLAAKMQRLSEGVSLGLVYHLN